MIWNDAGCNMPRIEYHPGSHWSRIEYHPGINGKRPRRQHMNGGEDNAALRITGILLLMWASASVMAPTSVTTTAFVWAPASVATPASAMASSSVVVLASGVIPTSMMPPASATAVALMASVMLPTTTTFFLTGIRHFIACHFIACHFIACHCIRCRGLICNKKDWRYNSNKHALEELDK